MREYEEVDGGVRKTFSWGYAEIYGAFEDCFTDKELLTVLRDLKTMKDNGIKDDRLDEKYKKVKEKLKAKVSRSSLRP